MRYRNKKTGAVIDVSSKLGGNWEPIESEKACEPSAPLSEEKPKRNRKTAKK